MGACLCSWGNKTQTFKRNVFIYAQWDKRAYMTARDARAPAEMPPLRLTHWMGRLGNNILQVLHVLAYAEHFRTRVELPQQKPGVLRHLPNAYDFAPTDARKNAIAIKADAFYPFKQKTRDFLQQTLPFGEAPLTPDEVWRIGREYLAEPIARALPAFPEFGDETLVIHIRSGDSFRPNPHPNFWQPPLAYYQKIFQEGGYSKILVITEADKSRNPCIAALQAWQPEITRVHSGALEGDIAMLCGARHLVIGIGSFVHSLMTCLHSNARLQTLHACYDPINWEPWIYFPAHPVGFDLRIYEFENYYRQMIPFRNAREQLDLMLTLPLECVGLREKRERV